MEQPEQLGRAAGDVDPEVGDLKAVGDGVYPLTAPEAVLAEAAVEDRSSPGATAQIVVVAPAEEAIVVVAAEQDIDAVAAVEEVVAGSRPPGGPSRRCPRAVIVTGATEQMVAATLALQMVARRPCRRAHWRRCCR